MYPSMLPKGTLIRIGARKGMDKTAFGIVFVLPDNVTIDKYGRAGHIYMCKVIENPNGWHGDKVNYVFDLQYDTALSGNTHYKTLLEKVED